MATAETSSVPVSLFVKVIDPAVTPVAVWLIAVLTEAKAFAAPVATALALAATVIEPLFVRSIVADSPSACCQMPDETVALALAASALASASAVMLIEPSLVSETLAVVVATALWMMAD